MKLTKEETRNGWDPKSLKRYLESRDRAHRIAISNKPIERPTVAQRAYNPKRWRQPDGR